MGRTLSKTPCNPFGIEDLSVMRSIPGITVVSPADCFEMGKCLEAARDLEQPIYIRLTGGVGMPIVYEEDYEFKIGKATVLRPVNRVTIIAHGTTVGHALKAVKAIERGGATVGLINMHTIKPIDEEILDRAIEGSQHIMVFEEHTVVGGLGSAVLEYMNDSQQSGATVHRLGLKDIFPKTGSYEFMLKTLGLDAAGIEASIRKILDDEQ